MKLSSISCTVITLAALTCSVTAIPTQYSSSHHGEVPPSGQPQGTGVYLRDLEDDNLFARGPHDPHDHHHQPQSHNYQSQSHNHQSQSHQLQSSGGGSFQRRDLGEDNLFARATHHAGGQGYNPDAGLRRRDLEDDEDLFARHDSEHHGQEHTDPSGPVYRRGLEGRRLVARSTQYNNYD